MGSSQFDGDLTKGLTWPGKLFLWRNTRFHDSMASALRLADGETMLSVSLSRS